MEITKTVIDKAYKYCEEVLGKYPKGIYADNEAMEAGYCGPDVPFFNCVEVDCEDSEILESEHCYIASGASKFVIVPDDENFVLKFNITGTVDGNGGLMSEMITDTLAYEEQVYNELSEDAKKVYFPVECIFQYHGLDVYIQEKYDNTMDCLGYNDSVFSKDVVNEYDDWKNRSNINHYVPASMRKQLDELYSLKNFHSARHAYLNWIKRLGINTARAAVMSLLENDISDLHGGNVVVDKTGLIRFCDYGGYHHDTHWKFYGDSNGDYYSTEFSSRNDSSGYCNTPRSRQVI